MAMKHISEFLPEIKKPEYRFKFEIVDVGADEIVISGSTYVSEVSDDGSCESIELELFSGLRAFKKIAAKRQEVEDDANRMTEHND